MKICFRIGKIEHCYTLPILEIPVTWHIPGPGPVNYPQFIEDAVLLASVQALASKASDGGIRKALQAGFDTAIQALQKRAGEHVTVQAQGE
jgi:hypothetical protein